MIIRAGFKSECITDGSEEESVTGDMCKEDAESAIAMLDLTIKSIRRQIDAVDVTEADGKETQK